MNPIANNKQLCSLDALRGFDMLWIMGLSEMILKFARTKDTPFWKNMKNVNDIFYETHTNKAGGAFKQGGFEDDVIPNGTTTDFSNCDLYEIEDGMPANFVKESVSCNSTDLLFNNVNSSDLHLQLGSPCISTGKTIDFIKSDYDSVSGAQGAAYDIGAYESQSVTVVSIIGIQKKLCQSFPGSGRRQIRRFQFRSG